jgi:hypothetical protein
LIGVVRGMMLSKVGQGRLSTIIGDGRIDASLEKVVDDGGG